MDLRPTAAWTTRGARRDSTVGGPDGDGESQLGLHAHPRGAEERGPSGGAVDDRHDPKAEGIPPSRERPTAWRTFLRAHWPALVAADFFTTEVWTLRGLVTYYTLFVIELHSRKIQVVGSTRHPDEAFVLQAMRDLTDGIHGVLGRGRVLICDRDRKWSRAALEFLEREGVRIVRTPVCAPNCNAHAERVVRSIKEECLDRVIPLGERHFRRTITDFVAHYHGERNHQGISNELIQPLGRLDGHAPVRRRERMGGLLNYYYRAA